MSGVQQPGTQMAADLKEQLALCDDRVRGTGSLDPDAPVAWIVRCRGAVGDPRTHGSREPRAQVEADLTGMRMSPGVQHDLIILLSAGEIFVDDQPCVI